MNTSDPVEGKDSVLYPCSKFYKVFRTGNTISCKFLKRHFRSFNAKVYKRIVYSSTVNENSTAEKLFDNRQFEIEDGNLDGKFCKADSYQEEILKGYSLNKKYRWRLQQHIIEANKAGWLADENYSVSFLENVVYFHEFDVIRKFQENITLYCNQDGNLKKSRQLSKQRDLIVENLSDSEKKPISVQYIFSKQYLPKSSLNLQRKYSLVKNLNSSKIQEKRHNKYLIKSWYTDDLSSSEFEATTDEDEDTSETSNSIILNDFLRKKKPAKTNQRKQKLWKDFVVESTQEKKRNNSDLVIEEYDECSSPNNPDKNQDIMFKFLLPTDSIKNLLTDCLEENVFVLDSKSKPVWYLFDFSHALLEKSQKLGFQRNFPEQLRVLAMTTFEIETNDNSKMTMKLYTNCCLTSSLLSFEYFANNLKTAIQKVINYIFDWLQKYLLLPRKKQMKNSKNHLQTERELLVKSFENIFNSQKSYNYEGIWLMGLKELWKSGEDEFKDPKSSLVKVSNWEIECEICFEQYDISNGFSLACNHWFCFNCWKRHLAVYNFHFTTCPMQKCNSKVSLPLYLLCLNFKDFTSLESRLIEEAFRQDCCLYCRNPKCKRIIQVKKGYESMILCACSDSWCNNCGKEPHWPATCEQYQYFSNLKSTVKKVTLGDKSVENEFVAAVKVKKCTFCNIKIEKLEGCNEMTCICQGRFCWNCSSPWSDDCYSGCKKIKKKYETVILFNANCSTNLNFNRLRKLDDVIDNSKSYGITKNIILITKIWLRQQKIANTPQNFSEIKRFLLESSSLHKLVCIVLRNGYIFHHLLVKKRNHMHNIQNVLNKMSKQEKKLGKLLKYEDLVILQDDWMNDIKSAKHYWRIYYHFTLN